MAPWRLLSCALALLVCSSAIAQTTRPANQPQQSRGEVRITGIPLNEALAAFSDAVGVSVYANWRRLENEGIDPTTPITLRAHGITYRKLLELMLDSASPRLRYTVDEGVITIYALAPGEGNANQPPMITRVYDVTDLMWVLPDLDPNGGGTSNSGGRGSGNAGADGNRGGSSGGSRSGGYSR